MREVHRSAGDARQALFVALVFSFGAAAGFLMKIFGVFWFATALLFGLIAIGLATGQIYYQRRGDVSPQGRNRAIFAAVLFVLSMLISASMASLLVQ